MPTKTTNPKLLPTIYRWGGNPEERVIMDTSNRESDNAGLPQDMKINIFESLYFPRAEGHGRTCECYPCQQSNYRMDRDDPSVGGYEG